MVSGGAVTSGVLVAVPPGGLLGGYPMQYVGLRVAMVAVSAIYLLTTLSPLILPTFRAWEAAGGADTADAAQDRTPQGAADVGEPLGAQP